MFFGFSIDEDSRVVLSREAYLTADGYMEHLKNMELAFQEVVEKEVADIKALSAHGPLEELLKLKPMLDEMESTYYELMPGPLMWFEGS